MNNRIIAMLLILSHFAISTVWASSHSAEDANGCGDCIGYESPHIHIGGHSHQNDHDDDELHDFTSVEQAQQHFEEHHEHDEGHHVHLVFELSRDMHWQSVTNSHSEKNALRDGHYFNRTVAPPVPPPTA